MAMSTAMQSILANPVTGVTRRARPSQQIHRNRRVQVPMPVRVPVRCTMEGGQNEEAAEPVTTSTQQQQGPPLRSKSQSPNPVAPPPPPPPSPKMSTKFGDVLAFSGPAPERINGRLAMVGFVAAIGVELWNGQDVFAQISNGGIPWFLGTSLVFTLASLIPLFKGVSVQSKSEGLMTSDAELWNGRFAMLGLLALAFTEYLKGGALV